MIIDISFNMEKWHRQQTRSHKIDCNILCPVQSTETNIFKATNHINFNITDYIKKYKLDRGKFKKKNSNCFYFPLESVAFQILGQYAQFQKCIFPFQRICLLPWKMGFLYKKKSIAKDINGICIVLNVEH